MISNTLRSFFRKTYYKVLVYSTLSVLVAGVVGFHYLEKWRWLDAIDYCVSTMVTTGNSGITPQTDSGKIFNIFYMVSSVVLILLFINTIQQHFRDIDQNKQLQKKRRKKLAKEHVEQAIAAESTDTKTEEKNGSDESLTNKSHN